MTTSRRTLKRGRCGYCGQESALRADGGVYLHAAWSDVGRKQRGSLFVCKGSQLTTADGAALRERERKA